MDSIHFSRVIQEGLQDRKQDGRQSDGNRDRAKPRRVERKKETGGEEKKGHPLAQGVVM